MYWSTYCIYLHTYNQNYIYNIPVVKVRYWQNHITAQVPFSRQQFLVASLTKAGSTVRKIIKMKDLCMVWDNYMNSQCKNYRINEIRTFKPSAVQSETCHPWSWSEKVQDPFEICRYIFLKPPEGLSLTCKKFFN